MVLRGLSLEYRIHAASIENFDSVYANRNVRMRKISRIAGQRQNICVCVRFERAYRENRKPQMAHFDGNGPTIALQSR